MLGNIQTEAKSSHPARPLLHGTATSLENEFLRVTVDPATGCITSLFDKRNNTEALAPAVEGVGAPPTLSDGKPCGNLLQAFVDKPKKWDAWNVDADFIEHHTDLLQAEEVKLIENSPLRAVIRVRHKWQNSEFTQDITMYPGVPRVDVHMQADWHEKHILLKVAFPLNVRSDKATFEIPYGTVERPTTRNTPAEKSQFEVPALRWGDISGPIAGAPPLSPASGDRVGETHGFSLLNDSKYGYDAKDNVLRLSLLRAPEWPDPNADQGHHEFTYSLYPHAGTWREAMTVRQGYDLNYPLLAVTTTQHPGTLPAQTLVLRDEGRQCRHHRSEASCGWQRYDRALLRMGRQEGRCSSHASASRDSSVADEFDGAARKFACPCERRNRGHGSDRSL